VLDFSFCLLGSSEARLRARLTRYSPGFSNLNLGIFAIPRQAVCRLRLSSSRHTLCRLIRSSAKPSADNHQTAPSSVARYLDNRTKARGTGLPQCVRHTLTSHPNQVGGKSRPSPLDGLNCRTAASIRDGVTHGQMTRFDAQVPADHRLRTGGRAGMLSGREKQILFNDAVRKRQAAR
jgi:hypothetical protein